MQEEEKRGRGEEGTKFSLFSSTPLPLFHVDPRFRF
jgi:hypothetical protein